MCGTRGRNIIDETITSNCKYLIRVPSTSVFLSFWLLLYDKFIRKASRPPGLVIPVLDHSGEIWTSSNIYLPTYIEEMSNSSSIDKEQNAYYTIVLLRLQVRCSGGPVVRGRTGPNGTGSPPELESLVSLSYPFLLPLFCLYMCVVSTILLPLRSIHRHVAISLFTRYHNPKCEYDDGRTVEFSKISPIP